MKANKSKRVFSVRRGHFLTRTPKQERPAAARQVQTVRLFLRLRSVSGNRVRLQFVKAKSGRAGDSLVFPVALVKTLERGAERLGMCLGQFIIAGLDCDLPRPELDLFWPHKGRGG
jgi:hypothetical protein